MLTYESIAELVREAEARQVKISRLVLEDQAQSMEKPEAELLQKMERDFDVMVSSVEAGREKGLKSMSGLTGGEGYRMTEYARTTGGGLSGPLLSGAMAKALAVAGCNASMGRIVAAPTAGSCGILPGCLVTLLEDRGLPREDVILSMFTAGAVGLVAAQRASIAGAQGGCQAECGVASAMAAAALVELMGGTPAQCADACAIAVANQLGLVFAFSSADLALAGIPARIPADECLDAMREVGEALPPSLKETAGGGLAATPTGRRLRDQVFGSASE